jgi:hypothetical protein
MSSFGEGKVLKDELCVIYRTETYIVIYHQAFLRQEKLANHMEDFMVTKFFPCRVAGSLNQNKKQKHLNFPDKAK